ncbi:OmpA family protein [candidate division WOR-3 bacterium]|nr:OmpA family protein [candidate division WOR-3 bacterium]
MSARIHRGCEAGGRCCVLALQLLCVSALAASTSTTLLYQTPTADVLPTGALAFSADATFPLTNTRLDVVYPEVDASIRFSPYPHLDFALTAYTFADYALDVKYQLLEGEPGRPSLAVGVYDIGLSSYVSSIGHGTVNAWPDWRWETRPAELFSAFAVASYPVTKFARVNLGLGRGRFVGYSTTNRFLNTDFLFGEGHQWAVGLFGGVEFYVTPQVTLVAEAGSRDFNSGVKVNYEAFTAALVWAKMEGLLLADEAGGTPRFGRIEVGLTYEFKNVSELASLVPRLPARVAPPETVPQLKPVPLPTRPAPISKPSPAMLKLEPVWFKFDDADLLPVAIAALRRNADVLLAHPDLKVVVTGYASEEGSAEYNARLSGRRAHAVYEHLKSLGVPGEQMRMRVRGEAVGRPYPLHRVVDFEFEPEK